MSDELKVPFVSPGEVIAASVVLPVLGIGFVILRFCVRRAQQMNIGLDDIFAAAALICVTGMGISLVYGVSQHAIAYPTPLIPGATPEDQLTEIVPSQSLVELIDWIIWVLMVPGNGFIKLSFIAFYRRIFVVYKGSAFDWSTKISAFIVILWTIGFELATFFGCGTHVDYFWGPLGELGGCNTNVKLNGLMISDLITDIMIWVLPIPLVWNLQMPKVKKLSVTALFSLGAVSLAAAVVRLVVQLEIAYGGYSAHTDVDMTLTVLLYWSMIESGLALIASCLPITPSLLRHFPSTGLFKKAATSRGSDLKSKSRTSKYRSNYNMGEGKPNEDKDINSDRGRTWSSTPTESSEDMA